ncbi:MAG: XRE family transcriptional regulator, partial [Clostridia bacterium]|nr:XRE family transcriptional regulator [Clostridia bacterium]
EQRMGLNAVPYELECWKGVLTSKCKLFTNKYFSYVPAGHAVREGGLKACLAFYRELGQPFYDQLCSMLVFDALIYNEDRHFGNFGLLRDNRTGKFAAPAPIFDNGTSLFCYGTRDDFRDLPKYAATRTPSCGGSFDDVARLAMGPLQKDQLRRMISFRFEDTDPVCLPRWRIRAIEEQLQRRVYELLHL